jgi:O-antigen/teichoic acid export membrane protein
MSSILLLAKTAVLLLLLWSQKGLIWLVVANGSLELLFYGAYYMHIVQRIQDAPRDLEVVTYGRSLTWSNAILTVAAQLDNIILGFSTGFVDLAIYKVATILPENIKDLMKTMNTLSMPKIAERPEKKVYSRRTRRHLSYLLILNLAVVLAAIVVLPIFITLLYGDQYADSVRYAQALMLSLVFGWPSAFFMAALQARKQTRSLYRANVVYGVLQIGTLIAAVPIWGIWGIVLSRIISRWGLAFYQWHAVRKI